MNRVEYQLFVSADGYYAQTHCKVCGSTMGSGEYLPTLAHAFSVCANSFLEHLARHHNEQKQEARP